MDVNLIAPVNQLGYGVVGYNLLKYLDEAGNRVAFFPLGPVRWAGDHALQDRVNRTRQNALMYNKDAPSVRVWHQFELDLFPGRGERIGWPIFELNKFDARERLHLESVDRLIVCSDWAKSIIEENGIRVPVDVVPLGVDMEKFYVDEPVRNARPPYCKNTTIFINVGKWEKRKGHEELCVAFSEAFKPGDDVELWMINENPFIKSGNEMWKKKYAESKMGAHVKFYERFDMHEHLRVLFNQVDCGVFPSHAEGWNLEIPELFACGAHIIATNYSGHTQFVDENNSKLIQPNGMESAQDGIWFKGQGEWCSYSIKDLIDRMKEVHELKQTGQLGINEAGVETAKRFTWKATADRLTEVLETQLVSQES